MYIVQWRNCFGQWNISKEFWFLRRAKNYMFNRLKETLIVHQWRIFDTNEHSPIIGIFMAKDGWDIDRILDTAEKEKTKIFRERWPHMEIGCYTDNEKTR